MKDLLKNTLVGASFLTIMFGGIYFFPKVTVGIAMVACGLVCSAFLGQLIILIIKE